ncbi:MAG: hypothetical protein ABI912_12755 [Actinomycetota bacterium]
MSARRMAFCAALVAGLCVTTFVAPAFAEETTGSLVIRALTTPADARARFSFGVSCTGDGSPFERTVVVATSGGSGTTTVAGIPVDMACLVIDRAPAGWRIETDNPQAAVASAGGTMVEFLHTALAAQSLSVVKTSDPAGASTDGSTPPAVQRGALITYILTYTNSGDLPADVTITDQIAPGTTYAGHATCDRQCSRPAVPAGGRIRFAMPVPARATGSVSYAVRVAEDAADGDVIGAAATIDPGNNRSGAVLHRVAVPAGGLRVTLGADISSASPGAVVGYAIEVTNTGAADQSGVVVSQSVPTGAEYVAGSAGCAAVDCVAAYDAGPRRLTWKVGSLAAGETAGALSFRVRIKGLIANADGSLPGTIVVGRALASSTVTPATPSNAVTTVVVGVLGRKIVRGHPGQVIRARSVPARPALPATGASIGLLLGLAAALVASGVALLAASRSRIQRRNSWGSALGEHDQ